MGRHNNDRYDEDDGISDDDSHDRHNAKTKKKKKKKKKSSHHRDEQKEQKTTTNDDIMKRRHDDDDDDRRRRRKRKRSNDDDKRDGGDDIDNCSSSSSSSSDEEEERSSRERHHSKKKRKKASNKKKEHHKKDHHKKRKKKKNDKKKNSKKRKQNHRHDDDDDSSSTSSCSDNEERPSSRTLAAATKATEEQEANRLKRNYELADALHDLFVEHPVLSEELPIMLIRMVGGASFDLKQMTNMSAALGIKRVFECLQPYHVICEKDGTSLLWKWKSPTSTLSSGGPRKARSNNNDSQDLLLIKIIKSLLDEIGITMDAIQNYETRGSQEQQEEQEKQTIKKKKNVFADLLSDNNSNDISVVLHTLRLLLTNFNDNEKQQSSSSLSKELYDICNLILNENESISLDGIPNEKLRTGLENLFQLIGLTKNEIIDDDDDDDDEEQEPTMGYGLPDEEEQEQPKDNIMTIMKICKVKETSSSSCTRNITIDDIDRKIQLLLPEDKEDKEEEKRVESHIKNWLISKTTIVTRSNGNNNVKKKRVMGPSMKPPSDDDDDDEGPAPIGATSGGARARMSKELIKAKAEKRKRELVAVGKGISLSSLKDGDVDDGGGREEWMMEPGENELLQGIKAGSAGSLKSRTFRNEKHASRRETAALSSSSGPVDPKIQNEMNNIKQLHDRSRGPSLMEQHRAMKAEKAAQEEKASGGKKWKWDKDKDLDSGRRVDKNALKIIMGDGEKNLKEKFHGNYSRGFM